MTCQSQGKGTVRGDVSVTIRQHSTLLVSWAVQIFYLSSDWWWVKVTANKISGCCCNQISRFCFPPMYYSVVLPSGVTKAALICSKPAGHHKNWSLKCSIVSSTLALCKQRHNDKHFPWKIPSSKISENNHLDNIHYFIHWAQLWFSPTERVGYWPKCRSTACWFSHHYHAFPQFLWHLMIRGVM